MLLAELPDSMMCRCRENDHRCWRDEKPQFGKIRTHCGLCGRFIGYRAVEKKPKKRIACEELDKEEINQ